MTTEKLSPMQQEMINRADSIFASISESVSKVSDFGKEQIPDIAYQFILFNRAYITFAEVIGVAFLVLAYYLVIRVAIQDSHKLGLDFLDEWVGARTVACIAGVLFAFVGLLNIALNMKMFFMVWFAPKIFLIQELVNLAKSITH
jgi:hypothetical protein